MVEEERGGEGVTGDQHLILGGECMHQWERRNSHQSYKGQGIWGHQWLPEETSIGLPSVCTDSATCVNV